MSNPFQIGEKVEVYLDTKRAKNAGWFEGTIIRIDPYSEHRSFYWVEFDEELWPLIGFGQISVFNPKNIRKVSDEA